MSNVIKLRPGPAPSVPDDDFTRRYYRRRSAGGRSGVNMGAKGLEDIDELIRFARREPYLQSGKCPGCLQVRFGLHWNGHVMTCLNPKCQRQYQVTCATQAD